MTGSKRNTTLAAACAAVLACAVAAGCNILGPAGYFLVGPEKNPALHTLERDRPTVVFIDDRGSRVPTRSARLRMGEAAERTLLDRGQLRDVISSQSVLSVVAREQYNRPMGIAEIGQAVGAEVVIYAAVEHFSLSPDGQMYAPRSAMRVKVVDAVSGERLWPGEEQEWHRFSVEIPARTGTEPRGAAARSEAELDLAQRTGVALANVFARHDRRQSESRVGR